VREEDVARDRRPVRALDERAAQLAYPRAGVEQHQWSTGGAYLYRRRVTAVTNRGWPRTRNRPTSAPKPKSKRHQRESGSSHAISHQPSAQKAELPSPFGLMADGW